MSTLKKCVLYHCSDESPGVRRAMVDDARLLLITIAANLDEKAVEVAKEAFWQSCDFEHECHKSDIRAAITAYLTTIAEQTT